MFKPRAIDIVNAGMKYDQETAEKAELKDWEMMMLLQIQEDPTISQEEFEKKAIELMVASYRSAQRKVS